MKVWSSGRSQNIPTTAFWLQKNEALNKKGLGVITGCPETNISLLLSFELQETISFSALSKVLGSVPVQLLPQGWNSSGFGIHVQLPRLHIIHLTSLHRVSMATAAGLSYHSWMRCYILSECRMVWKIKIHCFATCICMCWFYVTELCSGITGIHSGLSSFEQGHRRWVSDIDEVMAVLKCICTA